VGNGNPADEGRAGTVSPTHPHNEPSLDGHDETKRHHHNQKIKTRNKIKGKRQVEKVWRRKMKERP
jgi:hypothetical protein